MTTVEKRRSGRKSGRHRKSSKTSSAGSFLDETDREVSNLTDRAFRSLCIGDEAVYNDSDLGSSSPCTQRDRQLAFSHEGQDGDREDREREKLKRAAHESFSLRMQQYGQDWIHSGMYGAEIHGDPQWGVSGEKTQGRVSATFQNSFVESSQRVDSLREEQLAFLSNGAAEVGSQQRRSRSRVSSLIKAFNSEGHRDGTVMDNKLREWNDETSWDKSALMSIQRELSEFSTSYQENFNSGHLPPTGPFSSMDANFYSSDVAALAHMNSASSFMRSSHSTHSMTAQVNCNSNFFIHSEFSPFKVWRDRNRFPFQQGKISGFMNYPAFPQWYETPMYKELSLEAQPQGPYQFEKGIRHPRNNLAPVVPNNHPRSISTSRMVQKALAVEKRCESELVGHRPHWKQTPSQGNTMFPSQRPSTASPTTEMSRRVQNTISSVKALQNKIKMMTEQDVATGMPSYQHGALCSNDNFIPFSNNAIKAAPNVVRSSSSSTSFNSSHLHTPLVYAKDEADSSEVHQSQNGASPQPVEHPPVRAESRGATPDVKMSTYKSKATSLLFNLKDNRKRVKSTYSPTKFKALETKERTKQPSIQETRDTVIDIPDFPDLDIQFPPVEESISSDVQSHQYANQYHIPGSSTAAQNSQPATAHTVQYSDYTSSDYQTAPTQGEMVPHITSFMPESYISNQLANGQNVHEDRSSFTANKQSIVDNIEALGGNVNTLKPLFTDTERSRINAGNETRQYLISKGNSEEHDNKKIVDAYQPIKDNKYDFSNVSSQDRWTHSNSHDTQSLSMKVAISAQKQDIPALIETTQHAHVNYRAAAINEELNIPKDKYKGENQLNINGEFEKTDLKDSFAVETSNHKKAGLVNPNIVNPLPQCAPFRDDTVENPALCGQQQTGAFEDKHVLQNLHAHNKENEMNENYLKQNDNRHTFNLYKDNTMFTQERCQKKLNSPIQKDKMPNLPPTEVKPHIKNNMPKNSLSDWENASGPTWDNLVKDEVKAQHWAPVEQPRAEPARLISAEQTGSENAKSENTMAKLTEYKSVNGAKTEHITVEKVREKKTEHTVEEPTKAEKSSVQKVEEEPINIKEETRSLEMKEEDEQQGKAEKDEAESLKEEPIKTELAKAKQAKQENIQQSKSEQATPERLKAEKLQEEQVKAENVDREQVKVEQVRTEKVEVEQAKTECSIAELAKLEHIKEQLPQAEQDESKVVQDDSIQVGGVNAKQPSTEVRKVKEEKVEDRKAEQANWEQTKVELAKAGLTKTDTVLERLAIPTAKLTVAQVKSEPDKVELVKTELAKAKAELAKIKQKMRGDKKEKVKNTAITENGLKKDVPLQVNANKKEECKNQDQAAQINSQREDSVVISIQSADEANRVADDLKCPRENSIFTDTTNKNSPSTAENVSLKYASETTSFSLDSVDTINNHNSKEKHSPTTGNTENMDGEGSFKADEAAESHYVYCESSKEFKLYDASHLPTDVDAGANSDTITGEVKDESVEKLGKCDTPKQSDVSEQRDSYLAKPLLPDRKPKSTEHSVGLGKDPHFTPPRVLSHKERAQTKQEILTSKIKAHAEKEISAIKEGFAFRDGFMSKSSSKLFTGSQSINVRQRPPSQEGPKWQESTMSSNIVSKQQTELLGIQMEPFKPVSLASSDTIPAKATASIGQPVDLSQKQIPKEPEKSNSNVPTPPREAQQTESDTVKTDESSEESQKNKNQPRIEPQIRNKEQGPKYKQEKQDKNHGEINKHQTVILKENPAGDTDYLNKKEEDPTQATAVVEVESSKPVITDKSESKHEAAREDSASSPSLFIGVNKIPADDSLQIRGIMVTVRERNPLVNNDQKDNCPQKMNEQISAKDKESGNSEIDTCCSYSDKEGNKSSKEVVQNTCAVKEDQTKHVANIHPAIVQETLSQEIIQDNRSENTTVKRTDLQQERPQKEVQFQESLAEKGVPPTATVSPKNKMSTETQPLLSKEDVKARETKNNTTKTPNQNPTDVITKDEVKANTEEKNPQNGQTVNTNENVVGNTGIFNANVSNGAEDIATGVNPPKSNNLDGNSAPLVEEKKHDSPTPKPPNKTSACNLSSDNKNNVEKNKVEDNVHIGGISIRILQSVIEDDLKMMGKHHVTAAAFDVVAADKHGQVAPSGCEEKVNIVKKKDRAGEVSPESHEKQMRDSSDTSSQHHRINTTSENTQTANAKSETAVEDYFQVQGVEMDNDPHSKANVGDNSASVGNMSDDLSKRRERPGLQPNKDTISTESSTEGNKVLDQRKSKTVESSSVSVEKRETEDKLAFKPADIPPERNNNKKEKAEAGQDFHKRKQHTENQSSFSRRDRQGSINPLPNTENTVKEKPEVKPKPKDRVSTIPEISALADYARLKVIVSEEEENPIQEFPPHKKEGFFPLIQTRHSRRPVFTADTQDLSVKEKSLPSKKEVSSKVNKEPKPFVFPITEKQHQRTGMFRLGDKDRQEKTLLDAKFNEGVGDSGTKHAQSFKERNKSPTNHLKEQASVAQVAGTDELGVRRVHQSIQQPNPPVSQATVSSSAFNGSKTTSVSQHLKPLDNTNPHEKVQEFSSNSEELPYLDNIFHSQPPFGQQKSTTILRKDEKTENVQATVGEDGTDKLRQERLATKHEENKAKQQIKRRQLEEEHAARLEERRAEEMRKQQIIEENRAALAEEERRAAKREEERRAREREAIAIKIRERREKQREAERRAEEERRAKQAEEERAAKQEEERIAKEREEEEMRIKEMEDKRRRKIEEERRAKLREEERIKEEQQRRVAQEEQRWRDAKEEQQRKAAQEEELRRAAKEEQQRRAAKEEQQRRAAQEEQQRRAAQEEQQRRAAQEEQQRRAAQEEQKRRAAHEEQLRRAAQEEQQRRAAREEQQRRAAREEQQRRAAQEEEQRRVEQEEQQRRAAHKELQMRAFEEEQLRREARGERQMRATQEEVNRRAAQEEQQRKAAQEEQQMRVAREAAHGEHQIRDVQKEQQMRATREEQQSRAAQEEQQTITEQMRAENEMEEKLKQKEEARIQAELKNTKQQFEEQREERWKEEGWIRTQREERKAVEKEKTIMKQREEIQANEERIRGLEDIHTAPKEKKGVAPEQMLSLREDELRAEKREEEEERLVSYRENEKAAQMEEQKREAQRIDALQYYAISSTQSERKFKDRQLSSPSPSHQRHSSLGTESAEESGSYTRPHRPYTPASPAPSLPRSNASSPALGNKPSMFRVKDNTFKGSSFTRSVKPRFHKNFAEDFRVGSPMDRVSERSEDDQETIRRSAGTPDTGLYRHAAIKESSSYPASSLQDYSALLPHYRSRSRRSIALDEDDSRSVTSNMSEDMESFATSAADLADMRGLYDYDRPGSACSFSSDVSRSLGKPPAVPPKSEKALRRAQRLTTRRIKKELSKADTPSGVERPHQVSNSPSSSSTEVRSSNRHARASPHFSLPISLANAPTLGSSLPSPQSEHKSSHRSVNASPHATGPVSLQVSSPHVTSHGSHPAAPKTVTQVPSSPTLRRATNPAPVSQYHVESSYTQSYPMTQRKVLQDVGSGQYFVVDVPVQVKTKTFIDPQTGKYVQLKVRESAQSNSRPQPQQTYLQPHLQPQGQGKLQQQALPQASPASKPVVLFEGYHGYPQGYQPAAINSVPHQRSSAPGTLHQDQQPVRESNSYGYPAPETGQNCEEHRYSPEKTPYMDTVNDKDKTHNTMHNNHGPYESTTESDTDSQLIGTSICENGNSECQPRDIITIGELEDFMELSDW